MILCNLRRLTFSAIFTNVTNRPFALYIRLSVYLKPEARLLTSFKRTGAWVHFLRLAGENLLVGLVDLYGFDPVHGGICGKS